MNGVDGASTGNPTHSYLLSQAIDRLEVQLTPDRQAALLQYAHLLQRWNRVYNLTGAQSLDDIVERHIVDCLSLYAVLRRQPIDWTARRILDVGSGSGLPGMVLGIALPDTGVTCLEPVGKKAAFLRQATRLLEVSNVDVAAQRIESYVPAATFDCVVSRAFSTLDHFLRCTRRIVSSDGVWAAMKSISSEQELLSLPSDVTFHVERTPIPNHWIVILRQT